MIQLCFKKLSTSQLILLTFMVLVFVVPVVHAAGFRELTDDDVKIGVWYPSSTSPKAERMGPFDVKIARDAPVMTGKHPIILSSHGRKGRYRNHHLTAGVLADAGFIVVAPRHLADFQIGGSETSKALNLRFQDLSIALAAVTNDSEFKEHVNTETVHGIGYSLGGTTILQAAGATFSSEQARKYCDSNRSGDKYFCKGWELQDKSASIYNQPIVNGKLVLVAPISQGISLKSLGSVKSLNIIAIDGDTIANPTFHTEPIFEATSSDIKGVLWYIKGHHTAFIAPFPKRVTDEEFIPDALDPKGFDRLAFQDEINSKILSLLVEE